MLFIKYDKIINEDSQSYVYVLQLNIINAIKIFDVFLTMSVYKNEEFKSFERSWISSIVRDWKKYV